MAIIPSNDSLAPSSDEPAPDKAMFEDNKEERGVPAIDMSNDPITFPDGGFRAWLVVSGVRHFMESVDSCWLRRGCK